MNGGLRIVLGGIAGLSLVVGCGGGGTGDRSDTSASTQTSTTESIPITTTPEATVSTPVVPETTSAQSAPRTESATEFADGLAVATLYSYDGELERGALMPVVIGSDDVPFVVVYDGSFADEAAHNPGSLFFVSCGDPACASFTTTEVVADDLETVSLASSPEGLPVVAYAQDFWDFEAEQLESWATVLSCVTPACDEFTMTTIPDLVSASVTIDGDGTTYVIGQPPWSDEGVPLGLPLVICADPACSSGVARVDVQPLPGVPRIVLGADGAPLIAGLAEAGPLVVSCGDTECSEVETWVDERDGSEGWPTWPNIAVGPTGPVAMVYGLEPTAAFQTHAGPILSVWEDDPTAAVHVELDADALLGPPAAVAVGADGRPVVAWMRLGPGSQAGEVELLVARCDDRSCAGGTRATVARNLRYTGAVEVAIAPDGSPVLQFVDENQDPPVLVLARCQDAECTTGALEVQRWTRD